MIAFVERLHTETVAAVVIEETITPEAGKRLVGGCGHAVYPTPGRMEQCADTYLDAIIWACLDERCEWRRIEPVPGTTWKQG